MTRSIIRGLALAVALGGLACDDGLLFEDPDHTYDGPPLVEFAPTLPGGTYRVEVTFAEDSGEAETVSVGVQYVGEPPQSAVNGSFSIAGGNAVEGEHYTLPEGSSFTIPAGENRTDVPVELLGAGLANGEAVALTLELADGEAYEVSANYSEFQIAASKDGG